MPDTPTHSETYLGHFGLTVTPTQPTEVEALLSRMFRTLSQWDEDEPREDWLLYQRDHADAATLIRQQQAELERLKESEFNRGVLIAVSTLINTWGAGTETEHLLAMIDATPEMVRSMEFGEYDEEPLLAALSQEPGR